MPGCGDSPLVRLRAALTAGRLLLAATGTQALYAFATTAVTFRVLGTDDFATWALQQVAYQAAGPIVGFGLVPILATINVPTVRENSSFDLMRGVQRLRLCLQVGLIATLFLCVTTALLASSGLTFAVGAAGAWSVYQLLFAHLRAVGQWTLAATFVIVHGALAYGAAVILIVMTEEPEGYWLGLLIGSALASIGALLWLRFPFWSFKAPPGATLMLRRGLAGLPATVANSLTLGLLRPLAGLAAGPAAVGVLALATQFAQIGALVEGALWGRLSPRAVRAWLSGDLAEMKRVRSRARRILGVTFGLQVVLATPVLLVVAGESFDWRMVLAAALLSAVPSLSIEYNIGVAHIWRSGSTSALSLLSLLALVLTVAIGFLIIQVGPYVLLPVALMFSRAVLGRSVLTLARRGAAHLPNKNRDLE